MVTDSGAQSSVWSRDEFLDYGFKMDDLIPTTHTVKAANNKPMIVDGMIIVRLRGKPHKTLNAEAAVMVYICPGVKDFFLSKDAMIQLGIIPSTFPRIEKTRTIVAGQGGGDIQPKVKLASCDPRRAECGCLKHTAPPSLPDKLPFECTRKNRERMEQWLIDRYGSSTFNQCPHQPLPKMTGPPIELHLVEGATPVNEYKSAHIPRHWYDQVYKDIMRDVELGVLEKVPVGTPTEWCSRMVVTRKHDGDREEQLTSQN